MGAKVMGAKRVLHRSAFAAVGGLALLLAACADNKKEGPTTRPMTTQERQDRAIRDPFGYKPDWSNTGVSGGGTADLDKEGLRKDLKHVLDP